jgi:hypothetical protein
MDIASMDDEDETKIGSMLSDLYETEMPYQIVEISPSRNDDLVKSIQSYYVYYPESYVNNVHYYISDFTIFTSFDE